MLKYMKQKKRVMLVFGTRPEAIKIAPLVKELQRRRDRFETIVCVTGQHREMLDQVLQLFAIVPDYDLNIMKQGQDLYDITARILLQLRDVLKKEQPDMLIVHGDTTTSMAAALAAFYQQIPVAHVEAGLRTHDRYSPWPEEMNRQITGRIATYHLAPTNGSKENLLREGVKEESIAVTGNTVIDALHRVVESIKTHPHLQKEISDHLRRSGLPGNIVDTYLPSAESLSPTAEPRPIVLITGHRRENFGEGFIRICHALKRLTEKFPHVWFIYPMHLNPHVRKPIMAMFGDHFNGDNSSGSSNLFFIEPLEYLPFVFLMEQSRLVVTDSGGIQEEAPGLGKPVLVMRNTTERPEGLEAGTVKLVGTDEDLIVSEVSRLLEDKHYYDTMAKANNPYGDGLASSRIIRFIDP